MKTKNKNCESLEEKKIEYFHTWNVTNLNILILGWVLLFKFINEATMYVGFIIIVGVQISIYFQNKMERKL